MRRRPIVSLGALLLLLVAACVAERAWRIEYETRAESTEGVGFVCRYYAGKLARLEAEHAEAPSAERAHEIAALESKFERRCIDAPPGGGQD